MILSFISIDKVPWEVLKTESKTLGFQHFLWHLVDPLESVEKNEGFAFGFQHFPGNLADVN